MTNLLQLATAIIAVESGGNDLAIGDNGRAIGAFQIHECVVADVNRVFKTHFDWRGMTNRQNARIVFEKYLTIYGQGKSPEQLARIWNGGPRGHQKSATLNYWLKVKSRLIF